MAFNPYLGRPKEQLLADLAYQQDNLAANKSIVSNGVGETHKSERLNKSIEATIAQILRALNVLDPANFPIDQVTMTNRTRVTFRPAYFGESDTCGDTYTGTAPVDNIDGP